MINMFAKILNYLRKDPYLWIAALPVAFFMLIVWLPYTINDSFGKLGIKLLPQWLSELLQNLNSFTVAFAPIIVYISFVLLFRFVTGKTDELNKKAEKLVNQTDQSTIRLIEGTDLVRNELAQLFDWAKSISFYGPLDNQNNFADILLSKRSGKEIYIYDTFINNKNKFNEMIEASASNDFNYNFCLYKQIIGTVVGYKDGSYKQLLFFKDTDNGELKGISLNKQIKLHIQHLKDDIELGVCPGVDFVNQITHIRVALSETLKNFWKSMNIGWTHPVMPPKSDKGTWEDEILSFFHNTAQTIAEDEKTKKIIITWRITKNSRKQASDIDAWLKYLNDSFVKKGCVERTLLIDKNSYKKDTEYKKIVNEIRSTYFSTLPATYSIEYRKLSLDIESDGYDFALFMNDKDEIIAVQGSEYDDVHERLLRIYFARDEKAKKNYYLKYEDIKTKEPLDNLFK